MFYWIIIILFIYCVIEREGEKEDYFLPIFVALTGITRGKFTGRFEKA